MMMERRSQQSGKKPSESGSTTKAAIWARFVISPSANTVTLAAGLTITSRAFLKLLPKSLLSQTTGVDGKVSFKLLKSRLREQGISLDIQPKNSHLPAMIASAALKNPSSALHHAVRRSVRNSRKTSSGTTRKTEPPASS